jgi:hypothetical protein
VTPDLPTSARLAWWGTAWLRGHSPPDDLIDRVPGAGALLPVLAGWRAAGCTGLALVLPVEGDLLGLGGPPDFNEAAYAAGEAVLAVGVDAGAVPGGDPCRWTSYVARRAPVPDLGEADRGLRAGLLEATHALVELDVARWRPEVADELMDLHRRPHVDHPQGVPAAAVDLAARALQLSGIVALAGDGAAVSAHETDRRVAALRDLERVARHALVSSCSPDGWPPVGAG